MARRNQVMVRAMPAAEVALFGGPGGDFEGETGEEGDAEVDGAARAVDEHADAGDGGARSRTASRTSRTLPPVVRTSSTTRTRSPGPSSKPRLNSRPGPPSFLFGDDAVGAEVAGGFVREDDAAGSGAGDDVRLAAEVVRDKGTELPGEVGPLEDAELFDVGVGVAAGRELEVAVEDGAAVGELLFEGGGGHAVEVTGCGLNVEG